MPLKKVCIITSCIIIGGITFTQKEFVKPLLAEASSWLNSGSNMYANVTGNVGIGTSTPGVKLEIAGTRDSSGVTNTGLLEIGNSLRLDQNEIITNTNTVLYLQQDNNGDLIVDNGSLTIDASTNKIGIGTKTPGAYLDIQGSADASGNTNSGLLEIGNTLRLDGNEIITNTNTPLYIQTSNNGDLIIDGTTLAVDASASRVGIGTTSPATTLDVNGAVSLSGTEVINSDGMWTGKHYGKVAVVAQTGGDYTSPLTAMDNISSWCGTPSITNPCLIKLMPGVYDFGTSYLSMQAYTDIEGSGENVTKVTSSLSSTHGVIDAASNCEIRFLTIENTSDSSEIKAIYTNAVEEFKVTHVTLSIQSSGFTVKGINVDEGSEVTLQSVTSNITGASYVYGTYTDNGSTTTIKDSVINTVSTGSGYAVFSMYTLNSTTRVYDSIITGTGGGNAYGVTVATTPDATTVELNNCQVSVSGAVNVNSAITTSIYGAMTLIIRNSTILATGTDSRAITSGQTLTTPSSITINYSTLSGTTCISNTANYTINISDTQLSGSVSALGTYHCIGAYDSSYASLDAACQ